MLLVSLLSVVLVFGDDTTNSVYNCTNIKVSGTNATQIAEKKSECLATGWCLWLELSNQCYLDKCLKAVSDETYKNHGTDPLCDENHPNNDGGQGGCKLYYLTGVHNCATGEEDSVTDLYCRESSTALSHIIIDKCFYDDLTTLVDGTFTSAHPRTTSASCQAHTKSGQGSYVSQGEGKDCTVLYGNDGAFCDCLGKKWCGLYPKCTLSANGNNCVADPCSVYQGTSKGNDCVNSPDYCVTVQEQYWTSNSSVAIRYPCVSKSDSSGAKKNNDSNECFYGYYGTSIPKVVPGIANISTFPECNIVTKYDACAVTQIYKNGAPTDPPSYCTGVSIPSGYFATDYYCNDGRDVPSLNSGKVTHMPTLLNFLVTLGVVMFFLK